MPIKGCSKSSKGYIANWNFNQHVHRKYFQDFQERWKFIMRKTDVLLRDIFDKITTCIVLHNIYINGKENLIGSG